MLKGKKLGRGLAAVVAALCLAVPLGSAVHADEHTQPLVEISTAPTAPASTPTTSESPAPGEEPPGDPGTPPSGGADLPLVPVAPPADSPPPVDSPPPAPDASHEEPSVPAVVSEETIPENSFEQLPAQPLDTDTTTAGVAPGSAEASPTPTASPSATETSQAAVHAALPEPVTKAIDSVVATASGSPLYVQVLTIVALLAAGYLYFRALGSKGRRSPGNAAK